MPRPCFDPCFGGSSQQSQPMIGTKLTHIDLEDYLPHRGPNMLLDSVVIEDATQAIAEVCVPAGDERGRELFGRTNATGERFWQETVLAELAALSGLPLIKERLDAAGHVGVFSTISKINCKELVPMASNLEIKTEIQRERNAFVQFGVTMFVGDEVVFTAELMSGGAAMESIASGEVKPLSGDSGAIIAADLFAWKPAAMQFVRSIRELDHEAGTAIVDYIYPTDHPIVAGHFPGAPLMMGVTQWQAVCDAAWAAKKELAIDGPIAVNGSITHCDDGQVVDIRDVRMDEQDGVPFISSAKRVAFRNTVAPGDGLLIKVAVQPA